jgi:hypothetical protein
MSSMLKPIALAAFCFACSLAHGEPEANPAASSSPAGPVFADSFGLNAAARASAARQPSSPSPSGQRWVPVADSFGLNNVLISAMADCLAAKLETRPASGPHRCVQM